MLGLKIRQDLTLLSKALDKLGAIEGGARELDRDPLPVDVVGAHRQEYAPHASPTYFLE